MKNRNGWLLEIRDESVDHEMPDVWREVFSARLPNTWNDAKILSEMANSLVDDPSVVGIPVGEEFTMRLRHLTNSVTDSVYYRVSTTTKWTQGSLEFFNG